MSRSGYCSDGPEDREQELQMNPNVLGPPLTFDELVTLWTAADTWVACHPSRTDELAILERFTESGLLRKRERPGPPKEGVGDYQWRCTKAGRFVVDSWMRAGFSVDGGT